MVTHTFLPNFIGGREKHVYFISKTLIDLGCDVCIFTGDRVKYLTFDKYDGIPVIRAPMWVAKLPGIHEGVPYRLVLPSIIYALKKFDPELIHAHDYRHFTTDLSALYANIWHIPLIITVHGFFYTPTKFTSTLMRIYDATIGLYSLKTARKIIVVSRKFLRDPIARFKDKVVYIPSVVLASSSGGNGNFGNFKKSFKIPKHHKLILSVGRIVYQKGFHILIKAFKQTIKSFPDTTLVIVGPIHDENYFRYLQSVAGNEGNVIFTGAISENLLRSAYMEADVVVIPSLDEGFPTVLLEAMSYRKPIIASSVGMTPEVITNGVNGMLVKPYDYRQLATIITKVLTDDELRRRLTMGLDDALQRYDCRNVTRKIIKVYEECLRN